MSKHQNMVCSGGFDFHCHSTISDGKYTVNELLDMALAKGLSTIAITDHNSIHSDMYTIREEYAFKGIEVIFGAELTALYDVSEKKEEIHIIALDFDPDKLAHIFESNLKNRQAYIEAILDRLRRSDIADLHYSDMQNHFESHYLGKMHVAQLLTEQNVTASVYEALDKYVGNLGERRCWVPSSDYIQIPSMDEVISSVISAGGVPVLAHPFYYKNFSNDELEKLVSTFKALAGNRAGMEVYYKNYSEKQTMCLEFLAHKYKLNASAGSDFHGWEQSESIMQFNHNLVNKLLKSEV